jgi:hypothetical protein
MSSRRIVFVCETAAGESLRSADAIAKLDDVTLLGIVSGVHDTQQLLAVAQTFGNLTKIVTAQETLLLPVAEANEALGLAAMSSQTVKRTLDKSGRRHQNAARSNSDQRCGRAKLCARSRVSNRN